MSTLKSNREGGRRISFHLGLSVSEILITNPQIFTLASWQTVLRIQIPAYQNDQMIKP
jgi:hypothetical protein